MGRGMDRRFARDYGLHTMGMDPAFVSRQIRLRAMCSQAVYTEAIKIAAVPHCR